MRDQRPFDAQCFVDSFTKPISSTQKPLTGEYLEVDKEISGVNSC